ncbi:MAG: hypothetical protein EBU90_11910 [Proteobacteria bacterium]|nr:hypothetical protein [Pseudomonadota bacterium]NBP15367.1 hypothetical protein [bacterium]
MSTSFFYFQLLYIIKKYIIKWQRQPLRRQLNLKVKSEKKDLEFTPKKTLLVQKSLEIIRNYTGDKVVD